MTNAKRNAAAVLEQVNDHLEKINLQPNRRYPMREVCEPLSIFDWWVEYLGVTKLRDMKRFLEAAIERGYTGYVCFKVGSTGFANGMWAYEQESKDGYSPDGACLYRSFTPKYTYWQARDADGNWFPETERVEEKRGDTTYISHKGYNQCKTVKQLDKFLAAQGLQ